MERLGVQAGQVVAGKYRLDELLGHGGMGSVWRAEHLELSSPVALKILKPEIAENPNALARFLREAKAAARLRSPHVVQILDHGKVDGLAYIAMELLEGESLLTRLKREQRLSPELCATLITHVGRAIGRAHDAGIVHRDLKPDNVFLVANEDEIVAKVLDFGIAKSTILDLDPAGSPQTKTGALLGTPYYMSPEQAAGEKTVDHRTDLWALGVIAFECLCGRRPFQSDALGELVLQICVKPLPVPSSTAAVPHGFDEWFARATARDPDERFQTARQMTAALRDVLLDADAATRRAAPSEEAAATEVYAQAPTQRVGPTPSPQHASASDGAMDLPEAPAADSEQLAAAETQLSGELGSSEAARLPDRSGASPTSASRNGLGAETLDPLSATAVPRKRRVVVGAVVALLVVASVGLGIAWLVDPGEPASAAAPAGAPASEDSIGDVAATVDLSSEPTSGEGPDAGEVDERAEPDGAAEPTLPTAGPEAPPPEAAGRQPAAPGRLPKPPSRPPARPPTVQPEEDPLGI